MILRFEVPYLYDALRALVTHAADPRDMKAHLERLYFALNVGGGVSIAATNGHCLAMWNCGGNGGRVAGSAVSGSIALGDVKKLIAFLKPRIKTETPYREVLVDLDFVAGTASVDGDSMPFGAGLFAQFPPAHQVIPDVDSHVKAGKLRHFTISPKYMAAACKSFEIACDSKLPSVQVFSHGSDERAQIVFRSELAEHLTIIVMPIRAGGASLWSFNVPEWIENQKEVANARVDQVAE